MNNQKDQKGSVFIWIIVAIFIVLFGAGIFWMYYYSKSSEDDLAIIDENISFSAPIPESSPNYQLVKDTYNLDEKQLDILSRVQNDDSRL